MIYPKLSELAFKLVQATASGQIKWQETETEEMFQTSFARSSVRIGARRSKVDDEANEFFIRVFNAEGEVVAELGDEDPDDQDERLELYNGLKSMFDTARHQASGVDDVLTDIIGEIDREGLPF